MFRIRVSAALLATLAAATVLERAQAAEPLPITAPQPYAQPYSAYAPAAPIGPPYYPSAPGYVVLDAPLNPTPQPNIPVQTGATIITNQALYPQEMLYPHRYRAMYPPFYYKVVGGWKVTPWGIRSYERYELQGTEVKVKYHSSISPFALFHPPSVR